MPPSAEYPLGTTNLGRDIYAQLVHGTESALAVGLTAALIVALVGTWSAWSRAISAAGSTRC